MEVIIYWVMTILYWLGVFAWQILVTGVFWAFVAWVSWQMLKALFNTVF